MAMQIPPINLFSSAEPNRDAWNLINRPPKFEAYTLTTKYRASGKAPTKRAKAIGLRRRRRPESRAESEGGESNHSHATSEYDFDKDFPDDFDYDAEDEVDPKTIVKRTPSQELYLKACKYLKVIPVSYFMRNLSEERIVLRHHHLGPEGTKACCMALLSNSTVTVLDLSDTNLGKAGVSHIADLLKENHFITELSLADNHLGIEGVQPILDVIEELDNIVSLNLSGNGLKERDAEKFKGIFEETQHLKRLDLSHNEFREVGGEIFGEYIGWNDTIEELDLSWNHLRNNGAKELAEGIEENRGLKVLDVSWNGFHLKGCEYLANALQQNTELAELNLNCNRINKECLEKLLSGFKRNTTLRTLRLAWNPITSVGAQLVLSMCEDRQEVGLKEVDIHTQLVEPSFTEGVSKLEQERGIKIRYGMVRGQDPFDGDEDEEGLVEENPTLVLMEFARLMGFRPIDLLSTFDKDKSNSLDKEELKMGLKFYCIPLSERCLDHLVQKLDVDGDGEIDLSEIMRARAEYKLKEREMHNLSERWNYSVEDTDVGRVRIKLQKLMHKKMDGNPTFKARVDMFQDALKEGKLKSMFTEKQMKIQERRERVLTKRSAKRGGSASTSGSGVGSEHVNVCDEDSLALDLGDESACIDESQTSFRKPSLPGRSLTSAPPSRRSSQPTVRTNRPMSGPLNSARQSARVLSRIDDDIPESKTKSNTGTNTSGNKSDRNDSRPNSGTLSKNLTPKQSRPNSSNASTQRSVMSTDRSLQTNSKRSPSSSNPSTSRRNKDVTSPQGNGWKPLNF